MENKEFILDQTTIKNLLMAYKLKIPDFQRSFVWKDRKKYQLLESLFKGFPIGAITLYEDNGAYYIIDGLQRINTLKQYLTSPNKVITFREFFEKVQGKIEEFFAKNKIELTIKQIKQCIQDWYNSLDSLYEYELVSVLYNEIKESNPAVLEKLNDLQLVEELRDILKSEIEISHDAIAIIIYKGDKEDLPALFKNINTGSVALSQYEILQSVWTDYVLDKEKISKEYEAFNQELELIKEEYEIDAVKEHGTFDIFKNIVGLNHRICCIQNCNQLFRFTAFKRIDWSSKIEKDHVDKEIKYYDNDTIGFEIYSTIICHSSNKIVKAIDSVFAMHQGEDEKINAFILTLNCIIMDAMNETVGIVETLCAKNNYTIESKYHSLYILAGIIFSRYVIDMQNLIVMETEPNQKIRDLCLDLKKHNDEKWFIDEKRQMGFFNGKIKELIKLQCSDNESEVE